MMDEVGQFGQLGHEAVEAENVKQAREVVAERHQAPLAAHLVEAANKEVPISGSTFEGAEGMLCQSGTGEHHGGSLFLRHPCAKTLDPALIPPPIYLPPPRFGGEAA